MTPRATVQLKGLGKLKKKFQTTYLGIEYVTF
jgi:hypothetical protein